jgi:hypothetical protein
MSESPVARAGGRGHRREFDGLINRRGLSNFSDFRIHQTRFGGFDLSSCRRVKKTAEVLGQSKTAAGMPTAASKTQLVSAQVPSSRVTNGFGHSWQDRPTAELSSKVTLDG